MIPQSPLCISEGELDELTEAGRTIVTKPGNVDLENNIQVFDLLEYSTMLKTPLCRGRNKAETNSNRDETEDMNGARRLLYNFWNKTTLETGRHEHMIKMHVH